MIKFNRSNWLHFWVILLEDIIGLAVLIICTGNVEFAYLSTSSILSVQIVLKECLDELVYRLPMKRFRIFLLSIGISGSGFDKMDLVAGIQGMFFGHVAVLTFIIGVEILKGI